MKRYIAAVNGLSKDDEQKFLGFIRENGWGWWHRIDNFWMIIDRKDQSSTEQIRDFLMPLSGTIGIVIEVPDTSNSWHGFAPEASLEKVFSWVHVTWPND